VRAGTIPAKPTRWQVVVNPVETMIQSAAGKALSWFPVRLYHLASHPDAPIWAGAIGNHVYFLMLEGKG
jgi:hypothetical protein